MAKVLGNDPFLRGAATRLETAEPSTTVAPEPAVPAPAKSRRKATQTAKRRATRNAVGPSARQDIETKRAPFAAAESVSDQTTVPRPELKTAAAIEIGAGPPEPAAIAPHEPSPSGIAALTHALQGLWGAVKSGAGLSSNSELDEYGKDAALERQLSPVASFLYEQYWRVSVEGAALLPSGPFLLVSNHSGALPVDGAMINQVLTRERPDLQECRWLVEDQIFYAPFLGTLVNRLGAVRACPENAMRLLAQGHPVVVFPEGIQGIGKPFAQRYQLKRLGRGGFAKLAARARVPIVPVAVVGAEEAMPLFGKLPAKFLGLPYLPLTPIPLPAKWHIRFGEPIDTAGAGDSPSEVQRFVDQTRESIEGMLQALLNQRKSIFA